MVNTQIYDKEKEITTKMCFKIEIGKSFIINVLNCIYASF